MSRGKGPETVSPKQVADYFKRQKLAGARGLYTPEMLADMDPESVATVLNNLVARVNFDNDELMRKKARRFAVTLVVAGFVSGVVLTFGTMWLVSNPLWALVHTLQAKR